MPFLAWWPLVNRKNLRADLIAGLTNAVIVLPQGVAFAMIAGLPPVYGLYSAMVPPIVAAVFGSSRHLISGPTTAISIVVFTTVSQTVKPGSAEYVSMVLTLTFLAGLVQFGLGLARMGTLVNFISHSVVVGFTAGAALLIATSQLKHFFGLSLPSGQSFLHTWQLIFSKIAEINLYSTAVALATLTTLVVFMALRPRWPGMLIAMIVGSLVAAALAEGGHSVALVGSIPASLPSLSMPDLSLASLSKLGSGAVAIAMLGLVEAVSIARSVALKSGQRIDGNQEFVGQGLSNIVGSFFSSYASSGSFNRSGVNYDSGAKTPLSAIFAAVALAAIVLTVAPAAAYLPTPAMAAVLVVVAWRLIDFHHIRSILSTSKRESAVLLTTLFSTLFVELEFAIYVGVMLSLVIYLMRTSRPGIVSVAPDATAPRRSMTTSDEVSECPQVKILRVDGSLFFGAVDYVQSKLQEVSEREPSRKHLLVVGHGINFVDIAGAEMLVQEAERRRNEGGGLYLSNVKDEVCSIFRRGGYRERFGPTNVFPNKRQAISALVDRMDADVCASCERRIFRECPSAEGFEGAEPSVTTDAALEHRAEPTPA